MQDRLIKINSYFNSAEANIAKSKLDSCGIRAFLFDENTVGVHPFYTNAIGGIRLMVPESEAEEAMKILELTDKTEVKEESPVCPECGSSNTHYANIGSILPGLFFAIFGGFFAGIKKKWECNKCGYKWKH